MFRLLSALQRMLALLLSKSLRSRLSAAEAGPPRPVRPGQARLQPQGPAQGRILRVPRRPQLTQVRQVHA